MKIQAAVLKLFVGALALLALALTPSGSSAQAPACTGTTITSAFGQGCASTVDVPQITDQDYGVVHLQFSPPASIEDVIQARDLNATWLQGVIARSVGAQQRSALVMLEVRVNGPDLQPRDPDGILVAMVPLAGYDFDGHNKLKFSEQQQFANRELAARLLIARGQTVRARVKVYFSQQSVGSWMEVLRPLLAVSAAFGASGFAVNALTTPETQQNLSGIESILRAPGNTEGASDNWIDLNFADGPNRLEYSFSLNPRGARTPRPKGTLVLSLRRRPSLFTDDALPGAPGQRLPNYHVNNQINSNTIGRIWVDGRVGAGMSPSQFVEQSGLSAALETVHSVDTTEFEFNRMCMRMRAQLDRLGASLSRHDRAALAWAAFVQGPSARRQEIQEVACIQGDRELWATYGFPLPDAGPRQYPVPDDAARDRWIRTTALALREPDPRARFELLRDLFAPRVQTTIAPGTVFPDDEPPMAENTFMDRDELVRALRAMRVGCRFIEDGASASVPRFSVLARRPDNNMLLTLTIDYGGSASGPVITGLRVRPTTDADFAALATTPNIAPRCLAANRAYAPIAPPTATPSQQ